MSRAARARGATATKGRPERMPATDALVTTALVGTAHAAPPARTETPIDTLTDAMTSWSQMEPERGLLLRAGALAIWRQAGQVADQAPQAAQPHAPETLAQCPPGAARLVGQLFSGEHQDLLPEALGRLRAAGFRLPATLLVEALDRTEEQNRGAILPALGERGHWLARCNPRWAWAAQMLPQDGIPADAETLWQEGSRAQRIEILGRVRAVEPAKAREWLEGVWKQEKADLRAELLGAFDVGLAAEDEPLLERALDDRAERVRASAASLLERIPTSACARRMRERAEAMLVYSGGKLDANPPTAIDKDWARDGLSEKPPSGAGERAWRLIQALNHVPPTHWTQYYSAAPEALLAATAGSKWRVQIVESWTDAAERFGEREWAAPLWRFWRAASDKEVKQARGSRDGLLQQVFPLLPSDEREAWALERIAAPAAKGEPDLDELLALLPTPWSDAVSAAFLAGLRAFVTSLTPQSATGEPWEDALNTAALALPPAFFADALEPLSLPAIPEGKRPNVPYLRNWLELFADTIRLRQRIAEEIPL